MKNLVDVKKLSERVNDAFDDAKIHFQENLIMDPFYNDFKFSFCWSSNAIEGNTLSLDDTISFLEYDEVRSGHTFSEYDEARRLNKAVTTYLSFEPQEMNADWIQFINTAIIGGTDGYRREDVFIGNQLEAIYYPPTYKRIPELMDEFLKDLNFKGNGIEETVQKAVLKHIEFERIHPFKDGNGRTGRIILNQCLINNGLLPITIDPTSKYRQAFRQYDKNGDVSLMEYIVYKGELRSIQNVISLSKKLEEMEINTPIMKQPKFKQVRSFDNIKNDILGAPGAPKIEKGRKDTEKDK